MDLLADAGRSASIGLWTSVAPSSDAPEDLGVLMDGKDPSAGPQLSRATGLWRSDLPKGGRGLHDHMRIPVVKDHQRDQARGWTTSPERSSLGRQEPADSAGAA
jgi:hypothetical protein